MNKHRTYGSTYVAWTVRVNSRYSEFENECARLRIIILLLFVIRSYIYDEQTKRYNLTVRPAASPSCSSRMRIQACAIWKIHYPPSAVLVFSARILSSKYCFRRSCVIHDNVPIKYLKLYYNIEYYYCVWKRVGGLTGGKRENVHRRDRLRIVHYIILMVCTFPSFRANVSFAGARRIS